ncbi:MAG TPA: hypothetical protein VFA50_01020 [Stellaceae bacterium]|nr:hypothetical protein [Stellaceae bacterium]
MSALIVRDDPQLRKIENAIAMIERGPAARRRQLASLLSALENERAEILRYSSHRCVTPTRSAQPVA